MFVLLVGSIGYLYLQLDAVQGHQAWVLQSHAVRRAAATVENHVRRMESTQRGHLLLHDDASRAAYDEDARMLPELLDHLVGLVRDNPDQVANAIRIRDRANRRKELLDLNLAGPTPELLQAGQNSMQEFEAAVRVFDDAEQLLLDSRNERFEASSVAIRFAFGAAALLNVALLASSYLALRRQAEARTFEIAAQSAQAWVDRASAEVATAVGGGPTVERLATQVLDVVASRLEAIRGTFYAIGDDHRLHRVGGLALPHTHLPPETLDLGETVVGRVARERKVTVLRDLPPEYLRVESSLGAGSARELLLVPAVADDTVQAVLELATLGSFDADQLALAERIQSIVGVAVQSARSRTRLQELFEETQRQAEELLSQQEELRITNDELANQATDLEESRGRLQEQQEELTRTNEELEAQAQALETQKLSLSLKNRDLEAIQTELVAKAKELEEASRYKSEFLTKMSHELRTPLNSLLILATLLAEDKEARLSDQQRSFARTIYSSGRDLLQLINDILDLSKLEARRLRLEPETFELGELRDSLQATFEQLAAAKGLALVFDLQLPPTTALHTDRQRIEQILRNFLSNAIKFTPRGEVRVVMRPGADPDNVELAVRDTGIGIPADKQRLVFEAFEQVDGSISRNYGGTGLGLTISRELGLLLGGRISLVSAVGEGSTFVLDVPANLPNAPAPVAPTPPPRVEPARPDSRAPELEPAEAARLAWGDAEDADTILVVEDDPAFRDLLNVVASESGFAAVGVGTAEVALEVLKDHRPRAVLLDLKLPGTSGLAVLERAKKDASTRHIPVFVLSAMEQATQTRRVGAAGHLLKPVSRDTLVELFRKVRSLSEDRRRRVLLVEDLPEQQVEIVRELGGPDVEVVTVDTGQAAEEALRTQTFDCMVLDLRLPDTTGIALLERLGDAVRPPVVIYTSMDLGQDDELRIRRHSNAIIVKGARSLERLLDEVNLHLHRPDSALPPEKQSRIREARADTASLRGKTVLLVDDDLRNVFALTSALEEAAGLEVLIARNGVEALERMEMPGPIDVVLMDIMMPHMDGYAAMRAIRKLPNARASVPIIALTAKAMKGDHERCLEAGASDYLPKPVDIDNLFSLLRVWVPHGSR